MKVFVHTLLDGHFAVDVDKTDSVEIFKALVQSVKGYEPALQHLYFKGKRVDLNDQLTIQECNITENSIVQCLMKLNSSGASYLSLSDIEGTQKQQAEKEKREKELVNSQLQQTQFGYRESGVGGGGAYQQQQPRRLPTLEDIPVPQASVEALVGMGFPAARAKKALVLNNLNVEAAAEWLIMNLENPQVLDAPLTYQELQVVAQQFRELARQQEKPNPEVESAIQQNVCTFCVTGHNYATQKWYFCETCNMVANKGVCESCAKVCHQGHKLSEAKTSSFFCDCGAGDAPKPCACLHHDRLRPSGSGSSEHQQPPQN